VSEHGLTTPLERATYSVAEDQIQHMVLEQSDFPGELAEFRVSREGVLDNETMASRGFPGSTEERFRQAGRITGYMRELAAAPTRLDQDGASFVAATAAHLFDTPDSVEAWMRDVFLGDFAENVGRDIGHGQTLVSAEELEPSGFFDLAVALKVVHDNQGALVSSTVVDFRVGRLLGVAFVGLVGDHVRLKQASELGIALERRIVGVVLEA
jgi:hypothetical protein